MNPEKYLIQSIYNDKCYRDIEDKFNATHDDVKNALERAIIAEVHNEIYDFSKALAVDDINDALKGICEIYRNNNKEIIEELNEIARECITISV